jgi:hypothetical protein
MRNFLKPALVSAPRSRTALSRYQSSDAVANRKTDQDTYDQRGHARWYTKPATAVKKIGCVLLLLIAFGSAFASVPAIGCMSLMGAGKACGGGGGGGGSCTGGSRTTSGGNTIITFTSSGSLVCTAPSMFHVADRFYAAG